MKSACLGIIMLLSFQLSFAQKYNLKTKKTVYDSLIIFSNTKTFNSNKDQIDINHKKYLYFEYTSNEQILKVEIYSQNAKYQFLRLHSSPDFDILDSLQKIDNEYYRFRIRFKNISETDQLSLLFDVLGLNEIRTIEIPLLAYTNTEAQFNPGPEDLYLGEVRKFEIITNNIDNLKIDGLWKNTDNFDYQISRNQNNAYIFIEPKNGGEQTFSLLLESKKPYLSDDGVLVYQLPIINHTFNIKNSRHVFLRMDTREITRNPADLKGVEVQLENNRRLQIEKTYRVEASEEVGSPLIAEIFTKRRLTNDKIVCEFRPYNDHKISEGSLFIKDGDSPLFITNVEISPMPSITKISILRNGNNWTNSLNVRPGEVVDIRIEGKSLRKTKFHFDEIQIISSDTVSQSDYVHQYKLRVPINISKTVHNIYLGSEKSGLSMTINEYRIPRPFDFINIDYGNGPVAISSILQPILHKRTVKDVSLSFDRNRIDQGDFLYGQQLINIKVRIEDKNGILVETRDIGNFTICPGESSPRFNFYSQSGCRLSEIYLNNYLSKKTFSLSEWSKIEITIEHVSSAYSSEGYSQKVVIYNQRRTTFDVDVSIPAGLITQNLSKDASLSPLVSGIGLAMFAQFSFYKKNEIKRLIPFKAGFGFLAQNALNFNPDAKRDLGLVVITSVHPIKSRSKFSFPLYGGFGYFMQKKEFFFLVGPGIRVSF